MEIRDKHFHSQSTVNAGG